MNNHSINPKQIHSEVIEEIAVLESNEMGVDFVITLLNSLSEDFSRKENVEGTIVSCRYHEISTLVRLFHERFNLIESEEIKSKIIQKIHETKNLDFLLKEEKDEELMEKEFTTAIIERNYPLPFVELSKITKEEEIQVEIELEFQMEPFQFRTSHDDDDDDDIDLGPPPLIYNHIHSRSD